MTEPRQPPKFSGEKIRYYDLKKKSTTYGKMPAFEEFEKRFEYYLDGKWEMELKGIDAVAAVSATEGEAYPSYTEDPKALYDFILKLVDFWNVDPLQAPHKIIGDKNRKYDAYNVQETAANLASTIMQFLNIEWI